MRTTKARGARRGAAPKKITDGIAKAFQETGATSATSRPLLKAPLELGQTVTWTTSSGGRNFQRKGKLLAFIPGGVSLQKDAAFRKATGEDIMKIGARLQGGTLHQSHRYLIEVPPDVPLHAAGERRVVERPAAGDMGAAPFGTEKITFLDRTKKGAA